MAGGFTIEKKKIESLRDFILHVNILIESC